MQPDNTAELPDPPFDSHREYHEWITMLARNNIDRDGSPAKFVAEHAVVDVYPGDETHFVIGLEPYADESAVQTRAWPDDLLEEADYKDIESVRWDDSTIKEFNQDRSEAVTIVAEDVGRMMALMESDDLPHCEACGHQPADATTLTILPEDALTVKSPYEPTGAVDLPPEDHHWACTECRCDS